MSDSLIKGFRCKAEPGDERYKSEVAQPVMNAIDRMPKAYRDLVHRFGYIDIYRAWRKGWTVAMIEEKAVGDWFELDH